jgi:2',3'-cyclic-nucleotide 2'-phosphodiesterase
MPRLLFIGDIVGRPGRTLIIQGLAKIKQERSIDIVIANAENAAGGNGLTGTIAKDLYAAGVDAITLGDHVWDQKSFVVEIESLAYVCRPANLPSVSPGRPFVVVEKNGFSLAVCTLLGRQFMYTIKGDCPFRIADHMLEQLRPLVKAVVVEIHAEATSEKIALGWYLDGRVSAVLGTHTHVPTADLYILPQGTAYQTDLGMSGPYDSVLGREKEPVIQKFKTGLPQSFEVAKNDVKIKGAIVDIDATTGKALYVEGFTYPF